MTGGADLSEDAITALDTPGAAGAAGTHVVLYVDYDKYGKQVKSSVLPDAASFLGYAPIFLTKNQVISSFNRNQ